MRKVPFSQNMVVASASFFIIDKLHTHPKGLGPTTSPSITLLLEKEVLVRL